MGKEGMKLRCPHCGYEWKTQSKLILVNCPSCGLKVKNKIQKVEKIQLKGGKENGK